MTQVSEIELIELDESLDDVVVCNPYNVDCDQPADAWWMASCCGKKFPFCWEHELASEIETYEVTWACVYCETPTPEITWTRFPIRST